MAESQREHFLLCRVWLCFIFKNHILPNYQPMNNTYSFWNKKMKEFWEVTQHCCQFHFFFLLIKQMLLSQRWVFTFNMRRSILFSEPSWETESFPMSLNVVKAICEADSRLLVNQFGKFTIKQSQGVKFRGLMRLWKPCGTVGRAQVWMPDKYLNLTLIHCF